MNRRHYVSIEWIQLPRASVVEQELAKGAALLALDAGKSPREAAFVLLQHLFGDRQNLFGGVTVLIDGREIEF